MQIRTLAELRALRPRAARRHVRRVELALSLPAGHVRRAEAAINAGLRACGCETGAAFVVVALIACVARFLPGGGMPGGRDLTAAGLLLLSSALVGKAVGLAIAEWRLRAAIDRLARMDRPRHSPEGSPTWCSEEPAGRG